MCIFFSSFTIKIEKDIPPKPITETFGPLSPRFTFSFFTQVISDRNDLIYRSLHMIIEGKFLNLNLKNIIDNYHYFDSLEILCNKFAINHLKRRFEYLLNDNVANLIKI